MEKPLPVLLDVDAGVDDTLAIAFALLSRQLDVKGITTVAGNVQVQSCTRNVLLTLEILKPLLCSLPPVVEGASKPLQKKLFTAKEVHGNDGIGNASRFYPHPSLKPQKISAVDFIIRTVQKNPHLTIIATGPLTNIALAVKKNRKVMQRVKGISVMGGAFSEFHNTGPGAEFNFYVDPHAADIVMQSGIPLRLHPLNVTEQCIVAPSHLKTLQNRALREYLLHVTKFYFDFHRRTEGFSGGYLHDPLAVAAVIDPSLFVYEACYARVESAGKYTRGMSVFFPKLNPAREAALPEWVARALRQQVSVRIAGRVNARRARKLFLRTLLAQ
ncbi:MAG: nucleoside hydrolase [Bacteroidota bacterium]|nr:nucleoside hydrolase [Bacteroidota bacterium]